MEQPEQYQDEFLSFQPALRSFLYRLVANKQDLDDLTQETFLRAMKNLPSFRRESSFKTWVFAIAANLARDFLKNRSRWQEDYQDNCRTATYASRELQQTMFEISQQSPHGKFVLKEHIDYCLTCMAKTLPLEEQICLMLKEIYHFKVAEIMQITGLSAGKVKHALADSREKFMRIFESRCSLINKGGMCHQCSELNGMFNPQQKFEEQALKLKLVRERDDPNRERLLQLRLQLARGIDPVEAEGFDFHNFMLENLPSHSEQ